MTARTFNLTMPMSQMHSSNEGGHWAIEAGKRKIMRQMAGYAARGLDPIPGKATLTVLFAFPDKRHRDLDNYSLKGGIDGAVDAGLITDDHSAVLKPITRDEGVGRSPKGFAVLTFTFSEVEE